MAAINAIDITSLLFQEGSAPSTPASTKWRLYFKSDGLYFKDDAGVETLAVAGLPTFRGALAYNDGTQTINNTTVTAITFGAESYDTDTLHDTSSNTSRITVPSALAGKWRFTFHTGIYSGNNGTGIRAVWLRKNGTTDVIGSEIRLNPVLNLQVAGIGSADVAMAASDYMEVVIYQSSGGTLAFGDTVSNGNGHVSSLAGQFLGT